MKWLPAIVGLLALAGCRSHPRHHDFVTNEATGVVTILDLDTGEILGSIALQRKPRELRVSRDGRHLLVTLAGPVVQPLESAPVHANSPVVVAAPPPDLVGIAVIDIESRAVERILPDPGHAIAVNE